MVGAYAPDYPRHQIIRAGLERVGVEVVSAILPRHLSTLRLVLETRTLSPQLSESWYNRRMSAPGWARQRRNVYKTGLCRSISARA